MFELSNVNVGQDSILTFGLEFDSIPTAGDCVKFTFPDLYGDGSYVPFPTTFIECTVFIFVNILESIDPVMFQRPYQ